MMTLIRKIKLDKHIIKYLIVGMTAFAVEYVSFVLLIKAINSPYLLTTAQSISFSLGLVVSFTGSRLFTFSDEYVEYEHSVSRQIGSYVLLAFVNLVLSNVVIYAIVHYFLVIPFIAKIIVMSMVVVWNFLIFKNVIFKPKQ